MFFIIFNVTNEVRITRIILIFYIKEISCCTWLIAIREGLRDLSLEGRTKIPGPSKPGPSIFTVKVQSSIVGFSVWNNSQ